jgi:hypothetical protein
MEFINHLSDKVGEDSNNWMPIYARLQDYKVWRFLRSKGYAFIHGGSWWQPTSQNKYADTNINFFSLSEFSMLLYETTMLHPIGTKLGIFDRRLDQWKRVQLKFEKLAEVPRIKEPTFTFAHMIIPHPPYVFDQDGNFLTARMEKNTGRMVGYIDQLVFLNKKIRTLVDKLLANSEVPPIIVLQADEGPWPLKIDERDSTRFNWKQADNEKLREKMGILNAYYLPGVDTGLLYPSITPVNSFRLIFNAYFGANFELLPDKNYVFMNDNQLYSFFEVTDKVR